MAHMPRSSEAPHRPQSVVHRTASQPQHSRKRVQCRRLTRALEALLLSQLDQMPSILSQRHQPRLLKCPQPQTAQQCGMLPPAFLLRPARQQTMTTHRPRPHRCPQTARWAGSVSCASVLRDTKPPGWDYFAEAACGAVCVRGCTAGQSHAAGQLPVSINLTLTDAAIAPEVEELLTCLAPL